jgi:protein-tyrosine phosphatase
VADHRLRLLVVCTANVCRSPVSAMMLDRALLDRGVDAIVESAGFLEGGFPACATMSAFGSDIGLDLSFHESRTLDAHLVGAAGLVLAMERRHARDLMVAFDRGFERIFTVGGFIAQATTMPPLGEGLDEWLGRVAPCRTHAEFLGVQCDDDVADPHGESKRIHRRAFDHLQIAMDRVADIVAGARDRRVTEGRSTHEAPPTSP